MSDSNGHPGFALARKAVYRGLMLGLRVLTRPVERRHFRLVILKLDRLGDAVLALGAMRRLMNEHGEADTLLIVSPIAEPLLRGEFPRAAFLVMPAFCERLCPDLIQALAHHARALRGIAAEVLVCLRHQPSDYLHAITGLVNAAKTFATAWSGPREHTSLAHPRCETAPYPEQGGDSCRELEAHRRLLELVFKSPVTLEDVTPRLGSGDSGESARLWGTAIPASQGGRLFSMPNEAPQAGRLCSIPGEFLLVCPSAGDALREYPPALLAESARVFREGHPTVPVRLCLPPGADGRTLGEAFTRAGVDHSWIHPADANALARVIASAGLLLASDSAPAHLATALDKPGVFLLGGGHHGMFAPWSRSARQRWLSHPLPCYHCRWRCTQTEPFCITRIAPRDVAAALAEAYTRRQK